MSTIESQKLAPILGIDPNLDFTQLQAEIQAHWPANVAMLYQKHLAYKERAAALSDEWRGRYIPPDVLRKMRRLWNQSLKLFVQFYQEEFAWRREVSREHE